MADQQQAGAFGRAPAQRAFEKGDALRVEVVGRLVEQHGVGRRLQAGPQSEELQLAAGQAVEPLAKARRQPGRQTFCAGTGQAQQFSAIERHAVDQRRLLLLQ